MYSSQKRRRIKPFARPTSFDINVAYDIRHFQSVKYNPNQDAFFPASATPESFKVCEGELMMQCSTPSVRRYGDHQMHVFSFANGLEGGSKAEVLDGLKYAGVAVTEFTPEQDVFEQGFVMTVAGLNTLFNNGSQSLYPGDVICADIPTPDRSHQNRALQTGVPREKLQFVISSFENMKRDLDDEKLAARFIMGTALSYARPGNPVDVVLHKCNMICSNSAPSAASGASSIGENAANIGPKKNKKKRGK